MPKKFINKDLNGLFQAKGYEYDDMCHLMKDVIFDRLPAEISKSEANDKIRDMMFSVLDLAPEDVNNKKLFNRAMKKNKEKLFEVIEDVVEDMLVQGWSENPFFMQFVDMKNMSDGDTNEFYTEQETYLAVAEVSGSNHDIMLQRLGEGETFTVKISHYGAAVGTDIQLFLTGRRDWTELVNAIYKAFDRKVKDTVYAEVIAVGDKLPVSSMFNKNIQLTTATKDQVDQLIEDVSAANDGADVVIMGTPSALRKLSALTDINWVSGNMKDEKYETGRLGFYEGTSLVEVPQRMLRKGDTLERMVATDILLVLPVGIDKFVKFVNVGDPEILEITEQGARVDNTMKFEYQQSFGVATVVGKYFGCIKIAAA